MKIGAIIQARLSSERFPNKVIMNLPYDSGICVLQQIIRRVSNSKLIDEVLVATSSNSEDDKLVDVAKLENVPYYRGSLNNVLDRFYNAAFKFNYDIIIRVTGDNPCIDSSILDKIIQDHINSNSDYTTTALNNTFPIGMGCEVINFKALEKSFLNSNEDYEKEHVTPYIYKSHPEQFKINSYFDEEDNSKIRITLDTIQDYSLLCCIYDYLYEQNNFFSLSDILALFEEKPWLKIINADIIQKKVCSNLNEEIEEAIRLCDKQDLKKAKDFIEGHIDG